MAPDKSQINFSFAYTAPHVEKIKEPTCDTFLTLFNTPLEGMWACGDGRSVRNHSAGHWWHPKMNWRWNTVRSQWGKQDTTQISILVCQILIQALQLICACPLCSQTGGSRITSVAWAQCRQRMGQDRENRTTACSFIPCTVGTLPAVLFCLVPVPANTGWVIRKTSQLSPSEAITSLELSWCPN